ncbi:MAG: hypothetical protein JNK51_13665 [Blastocatellia bacterium]|mgnify:CR=1 FL=1|nr:hypothetical protein [Chloracidobacterium sp.]MBL8185963.1 hypothetical protein [Blastocatellia bacterium]HRJ89479.1 hypothetical protein [Pyrinomonadaceae bacterium]HRK50670.1 hypothetical protein [Pyrinomonadaceae bacterium]
MTHFLYLVGFALLVSVVFAVFLDAGLKERVQYGVKTFLQFVGISLLIAWVLYFIPWR